MPNVPISPEAATFPRLFLQTAGAFLFLTGCEGFIAQDYDARTFHVILESQDDGGCYVEILKDTTRGGPGGSAKQPQPTVRVYD